MTDCPGACNAAWRATLGGPACNGPCAHGSCQVIRHAVCDPVPGDPFWCQPDQARIRRFLAELDDLAALLAAAADGHREPATAPPRGNGHQPSPSPVADDLDLLQRTLLDWECAYRDSQGWPSPPRRGILASALTTTIAWLGFHLDGLLAAPFAEDFGAEAAQWHRRLSAMAKAGTGRHRKPVPCPRCGLRLLSWREGDDHVICGGCNRHMSLSEYHEELSIAAERAT